MHYNAKVESSVKSRTELVSFGFGVLMRYDLIFNEVHEVVARQVLSKPMCVEPRISHKLESDYVIPV